MRVAALACACLGHLACARAQVFRCDDDGQCVQGNRTGSCEPSGWCSFDDASCASGRRYGQWSGDGLAQQCVPDDDGVAETSTGATTSTLTSTTSMEASSGDASTTTTTDASSTAGSSDASTGGEPPEGLVLWYRFDEPSFDGVVLDATGRHDATCEGVACPTTTEGVYGGGAAFDGVDDLLRIAEDAELHLETGWTLAAWARVADVTGFRCIVAKPLTLNSANDSFELARDSNGLAFTAVADTLTTGISVSAPWPVTADAWVHVAGTWDGATLTLYVAGQPAATTDTPTTTSYTDLDAFVGASFDGGEFTNFLAGDLDELKIYGRALAPDEIAALATVP